MYMGSTHNWNHKELKKKKDIGGVKKSMQFPSPHTTIYHQSYLKFSPKVLGLIHNCSFKI